jgi:hypothetical protein
MPMADLCDLVMLMLTVGMFVGYAGYLERYG